MLKEKLMFPVNDLNGKLSEFSTHESYHYQDKQEAKLDLKEGIKKLSSLQDKLFAYDKYAVLIVLQAMDAAGKDGTIKHVMSGINPQGCRVVSFKAPSAEELDHDFLWRCNKQLPSRGKIGIFNRSYYEEVLVARVHESILRNQKLPALPDDPDATDFWKERCEDINHFEQHLARNGTIILKFFLHLSKEEQKIRFLARIENPDKNWKLSVNDIKERSHWDHYQKAYEEMLQNTSTEWAPWYVIPADKKWFCRIAVCEIIIQTLDTLNLHYPELTSEQRKGIQKAKEMLMKEDN